MAPGEPGIVDTVIQYLLNRSKLDILLVKITEATEDSYVISIECRVTGTGPVSSTISPMTLELTYNGLCFGKISLPEIKTSLWGTKVALPGQEVKILDMATYKAYVRSILVKDETTFQLEKGDCTIRALGIVAHCDYCLEIPIKGMGGPKFTLTELSRAGDNLTATFTVQNPSPVEVDHGVSIFELRNDKGQALAELKGHLKIVKGEFKFFLQGPQKKGVASASKARLSGIGTEGNTWCRETVQYIDVLVDLKPEFVQLLQD